MKISDIRDLSKDDVLAAFGLESRTSTAGRVFGTVGVFGVGVVVGAAAALLLAPKTGQDMRQDLSQRLRTLRENAENESGSGLSSEGVTSGISSRSEIRP